MEGLTTAEVAAESGFSVRHIERQVASGRLGSIKRGVRRLIPRDEFDRWQASMAAGDQSASSGAHEPGGQVTGPPRTCAPAPLPRPAA